MTRRAITRRAITRRAITATTVTTALLALLGACIDDERWEEHNRQGQELCELDEECESQRCALGVCQASAGAPGVGCSADAQCDSGLCAVVDGQTAGICLARCRQQEPRCPHDAACYQVRMTEGGAVKPVDLCLPTCAVDADCDTQASCVWAAGASAGYCFPR